MSCSNQKIDLQTPKMAQNIAVILGVRINSIRLDEVLRQIADFIFSEAESKVVFTPNAEFLVRAYKDPDFCRILNRSDINIPDGSGLILLSGLVGQKLTQRVSGAGLVSRLMDAANSRGWKIGIAGARKGDEAEVEVLLSRLKEKYPGAGFYNLDDPDSGNRSVKFEIVLACHGMGKQEKWILENKKRIRSSVFLGVGGSLDFLTGFAKRAPVWVQRAGLEWLWRGLTKPGHWGRVWTAVAVFPWLVLRERFRIYKV